MKGIQAIATATMPRTIDAVAVRLEFEELPAGWGGEVVPGCAPTATPSGSTKRCPLLDTSAVQAFPL
jgi:hypothetical protein